MPFTTASWDGSASRWPNAASYCRSCLVDNNPSGAEKTKEQCHFPVRAPGSDVYNVNALRAVVGGRGAQANFPGAEAARARARRLLEEYKRSQGSERSDDEAADENETIEEPRIYRIAAPSALVYRDDGDPQVEGMVVPYGQWSEVDSVIEGHFMERFAVGSLRKSFTESLKRMKGYFEHGRSRMFDRTPIMDIREAWDTDEGGFFRAGLLNGLPEWMVDGLRKGLYGVSLGANPVKVERTRRPEPSDHNPKGIEERTYMEMRVFDISLTPAPHYDTAATLRSITDELAVEALVQHPDKLLDLIRQAEKTEPPHSGREEPEPKTVEEKKTAEDEPDPQRSRSTQPSRDYLRDEEGEPSWRL